MSAPMPADLEQTIGGRRAVVIHWSVSSFSGWGVYGLNLALHWANDDAVEPLCSRPIALDAIATDPLRLRALAPFLRASQMLQDRLAPQAGQQIELFSPLLAAVNADFVIPRAVHDIRMSGRPTVAVTFFETARLSAADVARARQFPLIVTGSIWNQRVLAAHGLTQVCTIRQGIDPTLFHPAPALRVMGERFCVFSGGKLEFRKGQDVVVAAFARFARRHPPALLVSAWHNPWPELTRTIEASPLLGPPPLRPDGSIDRAAWVAAAGVPAHQFLDLGPVANAALPPILREMDLAVFASRCEGGTNLMAMECMACGVPTVLAANTGHLDLIDGDNCYALLQQAPLAGAHAGIGDVPGWGESSVTELAETMEAACNDAAEARRRGRNGAETLRGMTWARTAAAMKQRVLGAV